VDSGLERTVHLETRAGRAAISSAIHYQVEKKNVK